MSSLTLSLSARLLIMLTFTSIMAVYKTGILLYNLYMGTHFLGLKRLKKLSNKFEHKFIGAYEYIHKNGYQIFVVTDFQNIKYALFITKEKEYKLHKLPDNYNDERNIEVYADGSDIFLREWT